MFSDEDRVDLGRVPTEEEKLNQMLHFRMGYCVREGGQGGGTVKLWTDFVGNSMQLTHTTTASTLA